MEIRAIAPNEWKYTYSQSMQITGQTGNIGHLRGDFDSGGYGFYTTWNDHRPQWKTDEFKTELDEVINALRSSEYGLLQNRPAMSEYARRFPDSAFKGNYCTPSTASVWIPTDTLSCSAATPQRATITFTAIAMSRSGLISISAMRKKVSALSVPITRSCFVFQTTAKFVLPLLGAKSRNTPAVISTSIIPKSAITSIISASLPSVCRKTGRPMSRNLRNKRRRKHRSTRI